MWPFRPRSLPEQIGDLEDEIAGLRVKIQFRCSFKWDGGTPWEVVQDLSDLKAKLAKCENKLARLRRQHEPWTVETCSIAEHQLESVLKERAKLREAKP